MSVLITGSAIQTCFGNGETTFSNLLLGRSGVSELRYHNTAKLKLGYGYQIFENGSEELFGASRWLTGCVREALAQSGVDPSIKRVIAIVGTGLRELRAVERLTLEQIDVPAEQLHLASAVQRAACWIKETITLSNACSASGHALALAQDLIELGEADAVVVGGCDSMTASMLAMIARFADCPTDQVRPFDAERKGVLLGEGAAVVVVEPEHSSSRPLARILNTAVSCDASHETAPNEASIQRTMNEALVAVDRSAAEIDLVIAHGTGTALNDPTEARVIRAILAAHGPSPLITAVKGALGHTSGAAALVNLDVAIRCLHNGIVPAIVGLRRPLPEGGDLRFVIGQPVEASLQTAIVNAFGFGGVNSITLVERMI